MKKTMMLLGFGLTALWGVNATAAIDAGAPSASHALERAAEALHGYLHDNYDNGYGSHQMEQAAAAMHDGLHEWVHGNVTEPEISALEQDLKAAWNNLRQELIPSGLAGNGDSMLLENYEAVKTAYKELRFLLRKAEK